jgi:beta-ureidopropionase
MPTTVRAALVQATWTGDKESMIKAHEEYAREAAAQGAKVICFQELFYGPYFCQVQDTKWYSYAESVPGPTVERFQALARELGLVMVLPVYEQEQPGVLYNTAAVVDADGSYLARHTSRTSAASGRSSTSGRATPATRRSTRRSAASASTSATTGTSRRGGGHSG